MKILWKFVFLALLGISAVRARAEDEFLYFPITGNEEVTCGFCGYYYRSGACHGATDIDTTNGATEIYAAAAGEVVRVVKSAVYCRDDPFGTHVVLEHSNDYRTIYAHLLPGSTAVEVGDNVEAGQFLGIGDTTGCAWGSHLHFEVRDSDGNRVDPYDGSAEQQAMCLPTLSTEECGENSLWVSCPPEPYDAALAADADRDGFTVAQGDCDDSNRDVYPDAPERCDGIDNNCSGRADENFIILGTPCSAGIGECQAGGVWQCNSTRDDVSCSAVPLDPPEAIDIFGDGLDNNCNGETDEFEGDCPPGMALIPSIEVCIDRYEASRPPGMRWPGYGVAETAVPQSVAGARPGELTAWGGAGCPLPPARRNIPPPCAPPTREQPLRSAAEMFPGPHASGNMPCPRREIPRHRARH